MGGAIVRAILNGRPRRVGRVLVVEPDAAKVPADAERVADPAEAVAAAEVVLLAVKPQSMAHALAPLRDVAAGRLFVSIAAGITAGWLADRLPGGRVVRTMPNTPVLAGKGAVAMAAGPGASDGDLDLVMHVLFDAAHVVELDESHMDAATAVGGSGPAYFYAFVEALAAAGVAAGLPEEEAAMLARRTFVGAAALLDSPAGGDPADLRRRVTSPGGTTAAALDAFAAGGLGDLVRDAVVAAARRGRELSGES